MKYIISGIALFFFATLLSEKSQAICDFESQRLTQAYAELNHCRTKLYVRDFNDCLGGFHFDSSSLYFFSYNDGLYCDYRVCEFERVSYDIAANDYIICVRNYDYSSSGSYGGGGGTSGTTSSSGGTTCRNRWGTGDGTNNCDDPYAGHGDEL